MGHCSYTDIVLKASNELLPGSEEPTPLPLVQETCEYVLGMGSVLLETLKKCRQLKAEGSVSGGKVIITIQHGTETPYSFEFVEQDFSLTENLKKGDKISFAYQGETVTVNMKIKLVKR